MATNGIVLLTPTSVDVTGAGSSATINAGGSVTFSTAATLSLNDVFSSTYDNYMIDLRYSTTANGGNIRGRLRSNGSDNSTSNSYVNQMLRADSTTVDASRTTSTSTLLSNCDDNQRNGWSLFFYGPFLVQPTAGRTVTVDSEVDAFIRDHAFTHNQSASYDGFSIFPSSGSITGLIKVYGLVQ